MPQAKCTPPRQELLRISGRFLMIWRWHRRCFTTSPSDSRGDQMGNATQVINLAAGFLAPTFRTNRVRSLRDFGRLLSALGAILYLAATSAAVTLRENWIRRIEALQGLSTKAALVRA